VSYGFRVDARIYDGLGLLHLNDMCCKLHVRGAKSVQSLWQTGCERDKVDGRVLCGPALLCLGFLVMQTACERDEVVAQVYGFLC
jgi:hypothetical protein